LTSICLTGFISEQPAVLTPDSMILLTMYINKLFYTTL